MEIDSEKGLHTAAFSLMTGGSSEGLDAIRFFKYIPDTLRTFISTTDRE